MIWAPAFAGEEGGGGKRKSEVVSPAIARIGSGSSPRSCADRPDAVVERPGEQGGGVVALAEARVEPTPQHLGVLRVGGLAFEGGGDGGAQALGARGRRIGRRPGVQRLLQPQLTLAHRKDGLLDPARQHQGEPHRPRAWAKARAPCGPDPARCGNSTTVSVIAVATAIPISANRSSMTSRRSAASTAWARRGSGEGWLGHRRRTCITQISCQYAKTKPLILDDDLVGVQPEREAHGWLDFSRSRFFA